MPDLKTVVRSVVDSLQAIYEPAGDGFTIEVPLPQDRYQSVTLVPRGGKVVIETMVGELEASDAAFLEAFRRRAVFATVTFEKGKARDEGHRAAIRASVPLAEATREKVQPVVMEVAMLGDELERELTGGDVE